MKQNAFAWLPKWLMWLAIAGIGVSHLLTVLVVGYVLSERAIPAKPATQAMGATPTLAPSPDSISETWVQEEATRLLAQAEKDVQVPGNACYGKSIACPLWHYSEDIKIRQRALELIGTKTTEP